MKLRSFLGKCMIISSILFLFLFTCFQQKDQLFLATLKHQDTTYTVVLDAGHGGDDPGKISSTNILEKDINLKITLACKQILEKQNIHVVLTRDTDSGLYHSSDTNKKQAAMRARRSIMESANADLAVSIHQNSYPSSEVFGGQVFYYSTSEKGKLLASYLQTAIHNLNPKNTRDIKSNSDYYILKCGFCPVVICECGFLSNEEECALLNSSSYQKDMAKAIATGILSYLMNSNNSPTTETKAVLR